MTLREEGGRRGGLCIRTTCGVDTHRRRRRLCGVAGYQSECATNGYWTLEWFCCCCVGDNFFYQFPSLGQHTFTFFDPLLVYHLGLCSFFLHPAQINFEPRHCIVCLPWTSNVFIFHSFFFCIAFTAAAAAAAHIIIYTSHSPVGNVSHHNINCNACINSQGTIQSGHPTACLCLPVVETHRLLCVWMKTLRASTMNDAKLQRPTREKNKGKYFHMLKCWRKGRPDKSMMYTFLFCVPMQYAPLHYAKKIHFTKIYKCITLSTHTIQ